MIVPGLAPHTEKIFVGISELTCIKPFVLVGGTALSIQLQTRLSEDLDFMRWQTGPDDDLNIGWPTIERELKTVGRVERVDVLGFDQVLFIVDGVKISFCAAPRKKIPAMQEIELLNNLRLADVRSIGIMKMEAMMRRSKFRDYYDVYTILKSGIDIMELIPAALEHSGHRLKTKGLLAMLTNGDLFKKDEKFGQLQPVHDVTSDEIQEYIKSLLQR